MGNKIMVDESLVGYILDQLGKEREELILQKQDIEDKISSCDEKIDSILQQVENEKIKDRERAEILNQVNNPPRPQALSTSSLPVKPKLKVLGDLLRLTTNYLIEVLQKHGIKNSEQILDIIAVERGIKKNTWDYKRIKTNLSVLLSSAVKKGKVQSTFDNDSKKYIYSV